MRRRVTRRLTRLKLCTTFLNIAKHDEINTKFQFTGIGAEPENNGYYTTVGRYDMHELKT